MNHFKSKWEKRKLSVMLNNVFNVTQKTIENEDEHDN